MGNTIKYKGIDPTFYVLFKDGKIQEYNYFSFLGDNIDPTSIDTVSHNKEMLEKEKKESLTEGTDKDKLRSLKRELKAHLKDYYDNKEWNSQSQIVKEAWKNKAKQLEEDIKELELVKGESLDETIDVKVNVDKPLSIEKIEKLSSISESTEITPELEELITKLYDMIHNTNNKPKREVLVDDAISSSNLFKVLETGNIGDEKTATVEYKGNEYIIRYGENSLEVFPINDIEKDYSKELEQEIKPLLSKQSLTEDSSLEIDTLVKQYLDKIFKNQGNIKIQSFVFPEKAHYESLLLAPEPGTNNIEYEFKWNLTQPDSQQVTSLELLFTDSYYHDLENEELVLQERELKGFYVNESEVLEDILNSYINYKKYMNEKITPFEAFKQGIITIKQ